MSTLNRPVTEPDTLFSPKARFHGERNPESVLFTVDSLPKTKVNRPQDLSLALRIPVSQSGIIQIGEAEAAPELHRPTVERIRVAAGHGPCVPAEGARRTRVGAETTVAALGAIALLTAVIVLYELLTSPSGVF